MIVTNDFRSLWAEIGPEVLAAVERVGRSGWYVLGREVDEFERRLAASWGLPHAVGVASGQDAIEIALRSVGLRAGGKVLTTPLSAFATTLAIARCGGVPVFVDVDERGLIDLDACREALLAEPDIRHFVPVHLYGHALDLDRLQALQRSFALTIVEDCAQAIGARWRGRPVGTVGAAAAVSFYPTKNLGALGDGGAVLTAEPSIAARARVLRHYGQSATYVHDELGLNSRLDELQAALLADVLLPRVDAWTERRREVARAYGTGIRNPAVKVPAVEARSESIWHLFPVLVEGSGRDRFREHLRQRGISSGEHYPRLIPDQKALRDSGRFEVRGDLVRARRYAEGEVSLPIHPYLSDDDVERVVAAVSDWEG